MRLREYTAADREACLAVFDSNTPLFFLPKEREEFAGFLDSHRCPYFVLARDGAVIGCGGYYRSSCGSSAGLAWGMVAAAHQGRGLGLFLLQKRLARIKEEPAVREITLNTTQHTFRFFAREGFVVRKILKDGYAPGLDRYEMALELKDRA